MLYRPDRMAAPTNWALPIGPRDLWSDDPRHEDGKVIVREALRCRKIVRGLLDFARQDQPSRTHVRPRDIMERALDMLVRQAAFQNIRLGRLGLQVQVAASGLREGSGRLGRRIWFGVGSSWRGVTVHTVQKLVPSLRCAHSLVLVTRRGGRRCELIGEVGGDLLRCQGRVWRA